jgi:DNA-binding MarR family transcriptional regulator
MDKTAIRQLRKSMRIMLRRLAGQISEDSICYRVTVAQCHTLLAVEEKGQTTITELAATLDLDKSTLSRTIEGLVVMGLVKRETNADNRRSQHIELTSDGEKVVAGINDQWDSYVASLFTRIPVEKHPIVVEGLSLFAEALPSVVTVCSGEDRLAKKKVK